MFFSFSLCFTLFVFRTPAALQFQICFVAVTALFTVLLPSPFQLKNNYGLECPWCGLIIFIHFLSLHKNATNFHSPSRFFLCFFSWHFLFLMHQSRFLRFHHILLFENHIGFFDWWNHLSNCQMFNVKPTATVLFLFVKKSVCKSRFVQICSKKNIYIKMI